MKQVQQNYRSGELKVAEVPAPRAGSGTLLVATRCSLISAGTEKQLMDLAKASLAGKAMARPDLVRRVIRNVRRDGLKPTIGKVFAKAFAKSGAIVSAPASTVTVKRPSNSGDRFHPSGRTSTTS
mgnify:CR=1 FL=1